MQRNELSNNNLSGKVWLTVKIKMEPINGTPPGGVPLKRICLQLIQLSKEPQKARPLNWASCKRQEIVKQYPKSYC
jgi:hypothetical protein